MRQWRELPAWGISVIVNLTALFALHLVVQSVEQKTTRAEVITTALDEPALAEQPDYSFEDLPTSDSVGTLGEGGAFSAAANVTAAVGFGPVGRASVERKIASTLVPTRLGMVQVPQLDQFRTQVAEQVAVRGSSVQVGGGAEGAMSRLTLEIKRSLEERQTMVVWLFDASGSLNDRRKAIADQFALTYQQLEQLQALEGLHTIVASYGKSAALLTPAPVAGNEVKQLVQAVQDIKVDNTGIENVFTAVRLCIDRFKSFSPGKQRTNKLVFIVTDERGDDFTQMEEVINLCKQFQFRVFCIGNGSVFGQQKGYVRWTYPEDGYQEDIPLDQGPETAFAQALQLPFWGSDRDWRLRQMSAGYGPYTLTRLCAETGGMYLLTEQSRGYQFTEARMNEYVPDYRPIKVIEAEIHKNPAMWGLVQAAGLTYQDKDGIPELANEFRAYDDNVLRTDLTEAQKPAAETGYYLQQLHQILEAGEKARGSLVEPRWRASFDLAMGRILAMRVRLEGYNRVLAAMKSSPKPFKKPESNSWALVPSGEIDTGPEMRKAADRAREYLKKVIDENPGTPWSIMAERELAQDLGWSWRETQRQLPGMQSAANREEQARLLLAEDERQRQIRREMREKPRDRPKL